MIGVVWKFLYKIVSLTLSEEISGSFIKAVSVLGLIFNLIFLGKLIIDCYSKLYYSNISICSGLYQAPEEIAWNQNKLWNKLVELPKNRTKRCRDKCNIDHGFCYNVFVKTAKEPICTTNDKITETNLTYRRNSLSAECLLSVRLF